MALIQFIKNYNSAGGTLGSATVFFGFIADGSEVDINALAALKIIKGVQQYCVVAPGINNIAGHETDNVRLVIAEPITEPEKTSALWLRNGGSTFMRELIGDGNLMEASVAGDYRIYQSQPMAALFCDGENIGPVHLSTTDKVNVDFDPANRFVAYNWQLDNGDRVLLQQGVNNLFEAFGPGNYNGNEPLDNESLLVAIDVGAGHEMFIEIEDTVTSEIIYTTTVVTPQYIEVTVPAIHTQVLVFVRSN